MSKETSKVTAAKITTTLTKYADDVSEEDILCGKAIPLEVIVREEDVELTPEQVKEFQTIQKQIK